MGKSRKIGNYTLEPNAKLAGANLRGVDLSGADLRGIDLSGADLQGAILTNTNLVFANLTGANLTGAKLDGAFLVAANLTKATLTDASLMGSYMSGINLTDANLSNADMEESKLLGANLTRANMTLAKMSLSKMDNANLTDTNLSSAKLNHATLTGAYIIGTNLAKADLSSAILNNAYLIEPNLTDTNLVFTKMTGVKAASVNLYYLSHEQKNEINKTSWIQELQLNKNAMAFIKAFNDDPNSMVSDLLGGSRDILRVIATMVANEDDVKKLTIYARVQKAEQNLKANTEWNVKMIETIIKDEKFWQDKSRKGIEGIDGVKSMREIMKNAEYSPQERWDKYQQISNVALVRGVLHKSKVKLFSGERNPITDKFYNCVLKSTLDDFYRDIYTPTLSERSP